MATPRKRPAPAKAAPYKAAAKASAAKASAAKRAPAKRAGKKSSGGSRTPRSKPLPSATLRIRMYNVGFGDAFLLRLPTPEGERTVLVDCGQHLGGIANPMNSVLDDLIAAVTTAGKARIDVVIATHRHFDHISGFDSAKWKTVEVGEVWLPWTEERGNADADKVRTSQSRIAAALRERFGDPDTPIGWFAINSFSNAGAENTLLHGFDGVQEHRYLPARDRLQRTFTTPVLPGVTVHALGPSFDPAVIATLIPPEDQVFQALRALAAAEAGMTSADASGSLFSPRYVIDEATYTTDHPDLAERSDTALVTEAANENLLAAASSMEDAINGTSLMLVFEVGDQTLLLAGDAEWGTWKEVLADTAWRELLARTTIYKVSHHGSFNGTPTGFAADLLSEDATSLMSFRHVEKWPSIPLDDLVTALEAPGRTLIRSDAMPPAGGAIARNGDLWVELTVPVSYGPDRPAPKPAIHALRSRSERLFTDLLRDEVTPPTPFRPRRRGAAPGAALPAPPAFNWFNPDDAIASAALALRLGALASSREAADDGLEAALAHADQQRSQAAPEQVRQGLALFVTHDLHGRRLLKPRAVAAAPALFPRSPKPVRTRRGVSIGGAAPELDYWREDALANEHHQHWHEVYPYAGLPPSDFGAWVDTTPQATLVAILVALDPSQDWAAQLGSATREQIAAFFAQVASSRAVGGLPKDLYRTIFRLNDRQGELFFYMHAQMLARYDAELVSHSLARVAPFGPTEWDDPIPEGQNPVGLSPPFFIRNANQSLPDDTVTDLEALDAEIAQALSAGTLVDAQGGAIAIDRTLLGEAVEATVPQLRDLDPGRYAGLHNQGHGAIAELSTGGPGVMTSTVTAIRDQIFWRWHKHIDDINATWQDTQPGYPFDDAPPVTMRNDQWASPDIILCRTADLPAGRNPTTLGAQLFGGASWDTDFSAATATAGSVTLTTISELHTQMATRTQGGAQITYLTHEPFSYFLRIENPTSAPVPVTVRIFLVPADHAEDRRAWIEMDKLLVELPAQKKTVVYRPDTEASIIKRPAEDDPGNVTPGGGDPDETAYCDCGWPYTLLLPRGTGAGMTYRLMAICTDATIDQVSAPDHCGSMSYCGAVDGYPDTRDMGFPFSRPFGPGANALSDALAALPAAAARTVTIRHL